MWFQSLEEITFDIADPLNYLNCSGREKNGKKSTGAMFFS
jgi:hypothetical protein